MFLSTNLPISLSLSLSSEFRPYPLATAALDCSDGPSAALWSDASPISYAFPQAQRRPLVSSSSLPLEVTVVAKPLQAARPATRPSILRPSALPANAAPPSPFAAAASPSRFPSTRRCRTIPTLPAAGSRASSRRGGFITLKWYIRLGLSATNLLCPCSQRASHKDDKALVLAAANTPLLLDWVENICQLFMCPILKARNACSRSISAAPLTALGKPISRAWLQRN